MSLGLCLQQTKQQGGRGLWASLFRPGLRVAEPAVPYMTAGWGGRPTLGRIRPFLTGSLNVSFRREPTFARVFERRRQMACGAPQAG
jgi:hypothetical protein